MDLQCRSVWEKARSPKPWFSVRGGTALRWSLSLLWMTYGLPERVTPVQLNDPHPVSPMGC